MKSSIGSLIFMAFMLLIDWYVFTGIKNVSQNASPKIKTLIYISFCTISILSVLFIALMPYVNYDQWQRPVRTYIFAIIMGLFIGEAVASVFFLLDDLRRLFVWIWTSLGTRNAPQEAIDGDTIPRSVFISWLGFAIGGTFFGTLLYGFRNKYNYKVKNVQLAFANLPTAFKGLKVLHISDIHSGSFMDKQAVQRGVDLINQQKADIILFTGDLVNDRALEMNDYMDVFSQLKAPMGVYSSLGNHDYGDYYFGSNPSGEKLLLKQENLADLKDRHAKLGWRLLLDEFVELEKGGEKIALIGVQNISAKARFHSYGDMKKAYTGSEHLPFKILMSHDPSHWDKEVNTNYKDVDLTLSGHTHGMQFGVEIPGIKFSPVQWVYKEWDGLYENGKQKLYVNPGFGFIGYPGRVGILPEITVIELV